jgi:hypothetical protein
LLRRSYREGDRVRNETLANLTAPGEEKIAMIRQVLQGTEEQAERRHEQERAGGDEPQERMQRLRRSGGIDIGERTRIK